jgi:tetratricopeptide (TPR) repeat protein
MRYLSLSGFFFLAAAAVTAGDFSVLTGVRNNTPWSQLLISGYKFQQQDQWAEAAANFEQAIALIQGSDRQDRLELAYALNALGITHYKRGRPELAEPLYLRSLAIRREYLQPSDPQIAVVLNNIGDVRMSEGKYYESNQYRVEALKIDEASLGPRAPLVANDLNNLATGYAKQRRFAEAQKMLQRAVEIAGSSTPPNERLTDYIGNLAMVMALSGHYEEAEQEQNRLLNIQTSQRGRMHPSVALTLTRLADCAIRLKRYASAVRHAQEALHIFRVRLGDDHPSTATAYFELAVAYEKLKRPDLAVPALERVLEIDSERQVEPMYRVAHLRTYARILRMKGDKSEAVAIEEKAKALEASESEQLRVRHTVDVTELQQR